MENTWIYDAKTKKGELKKTNIGPAASTPEPTGLDLDKLKAALQSKGIIEDKSEVE